MPVRLALVFRPYSFLEIGDEAADREGRVWRFSRHGWPGRELAGEAGAHAAWLLAQHAPPDLQEECLPLLQEVPVR